MIAKLNDVIARVAIVFITSWCLSAHSAGQPQSKGKLSGAVVDIHAARISKAKLNIRGTDFHRELTCGDDGSYEIDLPVGNYKLTVSADGFSPRDVAFEIRSNSVTELDVALDWIVMDRDFVFHDEQPLRTDTPVLNATIQLRPLRNP